MARFQPVGRGVLVFEDTEAGARLLGTAPHGLNSDDALAAIGYRLDEDGRAVAVAPASGDSSPLAVLTVAELRARADGAGVTGAKRMTKAALIEALS